MSEQVLELELARHQWAEGRRALQRAGRDPAAADALARQVEILTGELASRLGQVFTLAELAGVYRGADRWSLPLLQEALPEDPPFSAGTVADAAFDQYSRRASDYAP